jgi:hypothetical protein
LGRIPDATTTALDRNGRSAPSSKQPLCVFPEGFSLHANTHLYANDRQGLKWLCRIWRGAPVLERLSRAEDGRITYRMNRPLPDGTTHLICTGLEFLRLAFPVFGYRDELMRWSADDLD